MEKLETTKEQSFEKISKSLDNYFDPKQIAVIQQTIAKETTMTELAYFLNVAKSVGLNPFNKEIWCYKDNKNNLLIFAARDGFLKKAQENPEFSGIRSCEVKSNDEFEIDVANNKIIHNIKTLADRGEILGAYAIVFRKSGEPTISIVEFKRYNKGYNTWKSHPEDMIKKVAESKALKLAFGISGLQIEDDFEVKNGTVVPLEITQSKKLIEDTDFEKFIKQSDDYIEKYENRFEFTKEQIEKLNIRKSQNA